MSKLILDDKEQEEYLLLKALVRDIKDMLDSDYYTNDEIVWAIKMKLLSMEDK